jgi:hypothetical protein
MPKKIGEFLLDLGVLTEKQVEDILRYAKGTGMRFGEAAVKMGVIQSDVPLRAYGTNPRVDFFNLKPEYLPDATRQLFTTDEIIRMGVLALGFKSTSGVFRMKKDLNIGLLDPSRKETIKETERLAKERMGKDYSGIHTYLVLADQFVDVLQTVYHLSETDIRERKTGTIDPILHAFLESMAINPS